MGTPPVINKCLDLSLFYVYIETLYCFLLKLTLGAHGWWLRHLGPWYSCRNLEYLPPSKLRADPAPSGYQHLGMQWQVGALSVSVFVFPTRNFQLKKSTLISTMHLLVSQCVIKKELRMEMVYIFSEQYTETNVYCICLALCNFVAKWQLASIV